MASSEEINDRDLRRKARKIAEEEYERDCQTTLRHIVGVVAYINGRGVPRWYVDNVEERLRNQQKLEESDLDSQARQLARQEFQHRLATDLKDVVDVNNYLTCGRLPDGAIEAMKEKLRRYARM